ncbi:hypothetical protein GWI33_013169 [Rhynchophorus ferrugineus]|uniref:TFIIS N-terminal domain-containing protein n=1 Tax=Rhynchophorus ferrugineus TaxID=354439 RepID=A0A834MBU0_RHYFE|nr:hypothetical protein GWI33_013169 [Rhynchophorus ferrugineus]
MIHSTEKEKRRFNSRLILHAIKKLSKKQVGVTHLEQTYVGKTVNSLKDYEDIVGENAKELVATWRSMVQAEDEREALENQMKNYPDSIGDNFSSHQCNIKLMCEENNREYQISH